jgi:hypothetical protein
MARAPQPRGTCACCGAVVAAAGVGRHLAACAPRKETIRNADAAGGARETLFHIRAQALYDPAFFLDLEMRGSAPLDKLDYYLRRIWLECCDHLSRFALKRWGDEIDMESDAADVLRPGLTFMHAYDFGTTSHTRLKVLGARSGAPTTENPIVLLARNLPPEAACIQCGERATRFCMECLIEKEVWGTLCDAHARRHGHRSYGRPIPLLNSPRLGMCGYDGPAEPPY